MHGLRVIDGGGHYSFDLVGFYDIFYRHFLIWKKNHFVLKKFTFSEAFGSGKKTVFYLIFLSPPPPEKSV